MPEIFSLIILPEMVFPPTSIRMVSNPALRNNSSFSTPHSSIIVVRKTVPRGTSCTMISLTRGTGRMENEVLARPASFINADSTHRYRSQYGSGLAPSVARSPPISGMDLPKGRVIPTQRCSTLEAASAARRRCSR